MEFNISYFTSNKHVVDTNVQMHLNYIPRVLFNLGAHNVSKIIKIYDHKYRTNRSDGNCVRM